MCTVEYLRGHDVDDCEIEIENPRFKLIFILNKYSIVMKVVVFTGAGISAESGIRTFRDSGGLWEEHRIEMWLHPGDGRDPGFVLNFATARRKQVLEAKPDAAHLAIPKLEIKYKRCR